MILEHALLHIKTGQSKAFEAAFAKARPLIAASPGFVKIEIRPCIKTADRYLLLAWWNALEDHTIGFRQSARYAEWKNLLHHFYEPFPEVVHFAAPL